MTFLNDIVEILDETDALLGPEPDGFGFRPTTVSIVTRAWPGEVVGDTNGDGAYVDTVLTLPPWIKVTQVSQREIAGSGGRFQVGDVVVGPIRPAYSDPSGASGGFTEAQLDPAASVTADNVEVLYVLAKANANGTGLAGEYSLVELRESDAAAYHLVLTRRDTTP